MGGKIIAAGHLCLDITPVFPENARSRRVSDLLEPGKLIHTKEATVHTGGSVANTGLALKVLGADVQLMGKVGDDAFGEMVRRIAKKHGAGGLIVDPSVSTSYTIVIAIPGIDRIFLHNPGANDTFCNEDIPEEALDDAVLFHFGYPPLMKKMYENDGEELIKMYRRMKEKGLATSLDFAAVDPNSDAGKTDWKKLLRGVLPYVDFFVPSFEEMCFILDRDKYDKLMASGGNMTANLDLETDAMPLCEELLSMGCRAVLIKCGESGMIYRTSSREAWEKPGSRLPLDIDAWADRSGIQPIFRVSNVASGTGAGDTSIAAYLLSVMRGRTPDKCAEIAAAEGACCVTAFDALSGLKQLDELEKLLCAGKSPV